MALEQVENGIRLLGGVLAYATLGIVLYGVWRGTRRTPGRTTGRMGPWLRSAWFYFASAAVFFVICYLGWVPLPVGVTPHARPWVLALGALLYFPGMLLVLWGRLALGRNYFVSTGFGAQLFAGHQLITAGPYAVVRHPMYSGLMLAAAGCLLIYLTWTSLLFVIFSPAMIVRACREESALSAEFGDAWRAYTRRVPAFIPRIKKT